MKSAIAVVCFGWLIGSMVYAAELSPVVQAKLDAEVSKMKQLAAQPVIITAVKKHNAAPTREIRAMTQPAWQALAETDPFVVALSTNDAAKLLLNEIDDAVSEAFISGADGTKVAFMSKPTNWNHSGKPKHDTPMKGQTWQGGMERDESTGVLQIQISVPIVDGGQSIGSLVAGINITKLSRGMH